MAAEAGRRESGGTPRTRAWISRLRGGCICRLCLHPGRRGAGWKGLRSACWPLPRQILNKPSCPPSQRGQGRRPVRWGRGLLPLPQQEWVAKESSLDPLIKSQVHHPNACDPDGKRSAVARWPFPLAARRTRDMDTLGGVEPPASRVAACPVHGTVSGSGVVMAVPRRIELLSPDRQSGVLAVGRWNLSEEPEKMTAGRMNRRPGFEPVTHHPIAWVRTDLGTTGFEADTWSER